MNLPVVLGLAASALMGAGAPAPRPQTVYAWFPAQFGSWRTDGVQWDCLTHLCFRSVELTAEGTLVTPAGNPPKEFVDAAHRHGVKVTVLVWGTGAGKSDSYLARYPERAAQSLLAYVRANNLDGVNLDDETYREINSVTQTSNRDLLTRFFRTLRRTLRGYHLSFAAPPVISPADRFACSWMDWPAIAHEVDAVIPMGYCLNPPGAGWTTHPEPIAGGGKAPWTTTRDLQTMVRDYIRAMGGHREKLLVGMSLAFGGYEWRCRTDSPLSPTLGPGRPITAAEAAQMANRYGRRWDARQQSPWYCHQDGDAFVQGWYSDEPAWQARLRWVWEQGLGGIGVWVLDGVNDPPERWQLLRGFLHPDAAPPRGHSPRGVPPAKGPGAWGAPG